MPTKPPSRPYAGNAPAGALFVYGTLMEDERQQEVIGRVCAAVPAILRGYVRLEGKWPYIVPEAGAQVEGWALLDLTQDDLAQLDEYEVVAPQMVEDKLRTLYKREQVEAVDEGGKALTCWVYHPLLTEWEQSWLAKSKI